jgi:hypothetical protein
MRPDHITVKGQDIPIRAEYGPWSVYGEGDRWALAVGTGSVSYWHFNRKEFGAFQRMLREVLSQKVASAND